MRKTSLFLVVLAALILAVPLIAWAQGGDEDDERPLLTDEAIPSCTEDERDDVVFALFPLVEEYNELFQRITPALDSRVLRQELAVDLDAFLTTWLTETRQSFARCAFAVEAASIVDDLFTETFIAVALLDIDITVAQAHLLQAVAQQNNFEVIFDIWSEMLEQADE